RPRRFAEDEGAAREEPEPDGHACADSARGGGDLPGRILVVAAAGAREERVPRGNRHWSERQEPGRLDPLIKSGGCTACHQLGTVGTRKLSKEFDDFPSSVLAWERRLQSGQAGTNMVQTLGQIG